MVLKIFIPTLGRIGVMKQVTLRELTSKSTHRPWLVCPPDEVDGHREYYDQILPCPVGGIGKVRHWILENSDTDHVVMMDDDMRFYQRVDPLNVFLGLLTINDIDPLIAWIDAQLELGYVHGGVSARQGNNREDECHEKEIGRVNNLHFFNRAKVLKTGVRFDSLPVMEDFFVTLSLLSAGYPNIITYNWAWGQERSGLAGGCSTYRTKELQKEAAFKMSEHFPEYVKVVEKFSKVGESAFEGVRHDVKISWAKAFKEKRNVSNLHPI